MDNSTRYEYYDAELKNQSKRRLKMLKQAIAQTKATITDRDEDVCFKEPKLKWRNPLLLRIKLPAGKRWEFILASECTVWLAKPPRVQIGEPVPPRIPLRGDHDALRKVRRRNYRLHGYPEPSIMDYKPELSGGYEVFRGFEVVSNVLDGNLDILRS
jgi:hypothetical protein